MIEEIPAPRSSSYPGNRENSVPALALALNQLEMGLRKLRIGYASTLHLSSSDFNALTTIGYTGEITPKELSNALHMTSGSVTAMIDRLEKARLVARRSHPTDRRSLLISLASRGQASLNWIVERYAVTVEHIVTNNAQFLEPQFVVLLQHAAQSMMDEADGLQRAPATGIDR